MIYRLIKQVGDDFGVTHVRDATLLNHVKQTAFTWTSTPYSICLAMNKKYFQQAWENSNIVAIVAPPAAFLEDQKGKSVIVAERADDFFYYLHNQAPHIVAGLPEHNVDRNIAESAVIAETALIDQHVIIGEGVQIGHQCVILDNSIIGDGTVIGPGCIIGVDGFFTKRIHHRKEHLKHYGGVRIGRDCKLHSRVTVSRSVNYTESTEIGDEVHIGHHSVIGHDCSIGAGTDISVQALIAGRAKVGRNCWIGAAASVANACAIGANAVIRIGAVVINEIPDNAEVSGNFAIDHRRMLRRFLKD